MHGTMLTSFLLALTLLSMILLSDSAVNYQPSTEMCSEEPFGDSIGTVPPDQSFPASDSTENTCECFRLLPPPCPEELQTEKEASADEDRGSSPAPDVI